jgi:hypothetical protein
MSETQQGPGWWQASDGRWYPPESRSPAQGPATPSYPPQGAYPPQGMYPPQGAYPQGGAPYQPAPKRGHGCLFAALGAVALIVILVVVGVVVAVSSGTKKINSVVAANNLGGAPPAAAYKIGDTAKTSSYLVTVFGVKDPQPPINDFNKPQAGDHFVTVDVQVTNTKTNQQTFSSILFFHLLDSQNHQYDETLVAGLNPSAPDGQIAGGQSIRGFVAFQVPDGTTGLKLRVQGSITAAGAVFALG